MTRTDTRLRADAWVAANVPAGDRIAADPSTLPLPGRRVVRLELPGPGRPSDPERDLARLRREGVKWVIVSGDVTDRVLAARGHYPREVAFYEQLAHGPKPAFVVLPERARAGRPVGAGLPALIATVAAMSRERRTGLAIAVAVFLSGAALLGLEITASRVLAPTFGSSLFVWGSLIGIVLTGLAIGYWAGGIVADRLPSPYLLVTVLTLGAVLVALVPVIDQTVLTWIVDWDPGPRLDPLLAAAILFGPASIVLAVRLADRRQAGGELPRAPRSHRRPPLLDLHRGQHLRHVRHRLLARSRARHRPGAGRRGGHPCRGRVDRRSRRATRPGGPRPHRRTRRGRRPGALSRAGGQRSS